MLFLPSNESPLILVEPLLELIKSMFVLLSLIRILISLLFNAYVAGSEFSTPLTVLDI